MLIRAGPRRAAARRTHAAAHAAHAFRAPARGSREGGLCARSMRFNAKTVTERSHSHYPGQPRGGWTRAPTPHGGRESTRVSLRADPGRLTADSAGDFSFRTCR